MKTRSMLFVEDHPVYREGLERVLAAAMPDLRLVMAADIAEAIAALEDDDSIDLCLTDQRLPDGDGTDLVAVVRRRFPATAIGVLSGDVTPSFAERVRSGGGIACLSKDRDCGSIVVAIRTIFEGGDVFDKGSNGAQSYLTQRRCVIIRMAADGKGDKQIGEYLKVTESAVRDHWRHIFDQLGAVNRTEAVVKAFRLRII